METQNKRQSILNEVPKEVIPHLIEPLNKRFIQVIDDDSMWDLKYEIFMNQNNNRTIVEFSSKSQETMKINYYQSAQNPPIISDLELEQNVRNKKYFNFGHLHDCKNDENGNQTNMDLDWNMNLFANEQRNGNDDEFSVDNKYLGNVIARKVHEHMLKWQLYCEHPLHYWQMLPTTNVTHAMLNRLRVDLMKFYALKALVKVKEEKCKKMGINISFP